MEFIKNNTEAIKQIQNILDWTKTHDYVEIDACHEEALQMAIKVLEQQPCEEVISRQAVLDNISRVGLFKNDTKEVQAVAECLRAVEALPPVTLQSKIRHCKECKYFEHDRVANIDGIPLIVAHEICSRWGDGCKTNEDGYCFLFEPKKSEG